MISVFVRRKMYYDDPLRSALWMATCSRWNKDPLAKLTAVIGTEDIRGVRLECEQMADSDPYIVSDDDLIPLGVNWLMRVTDIFNRHPEYGAISTLSVIEREISVKPPNSTDELYEAHYVGAPMILRKGLMDGIGDMSLNTECGVIYEHLKARGWKQGLVNPALDLRHNHLGHALSDTPGQRWGW